MAMGVPVVCSHVAAGGVDAADGAHLLAASTAEDTSAAILRILDNPNERARFAQAGRMRVLSHHAWPSSMKRLDAIIDRCLTTHLSQQKLHPQIP
jgi:glycosyltransferase involved in cell wall biosynthesis